MSFIFWLQRIMRFFIGIIADVEIINFDTIPRRGGLIVVSNHIGFLDAIIGVTYSPREDVIMLVAKKYSVSRFWRWLARRLNAIWLDRQQTDFHALRLAQRRLQAGEMAAIAPEGTRSLTGALQPGKPGAVYLAVKAGVPILPITITGTRDKEVSAQLRRLRRLKITLIAGQPILLPIMDRANRDVYLANWTTEMMCRLAAQLPESYRGVYADHPRVAELIVEE